MPVKLVSRHVYKKTHSHTVCNQVFTDVKLKDVQALQTVSCPSLFGKK